MQTMNISLPDTLKDFVEEQVSSGNYSSASEYMRELLRGALERKANERLHALLLEGLESGGLREATPEFWSNMRSDIAARIAAHKSANPRL